LATNRKGDEAMRVSDATQRDYALILGSNHHRARALRLALCRISEYSQILCYAPAIRTRADDGARYLNAAAQVRSALGLPALRVAMQRIETEAGRQRGTPQVALDIDIVASRDQNGRMQTHKQDDLQRDYVRALLAQIGFGLNP